MSIANLNDWTKNNANPPIFQNTYSDGHNTLRYKGGGGHERIYYAVTIPKSNSLKFSLKFCSPTGYSCSYGDSQEYIVIFGNQPSSTSAMTDQTILARTAVSGAASETPVLYTVSYANTSGANKTVYLGIDWSYIVDGVEITLRYDDIQTEFVFNGWVLNENNQLELTNGQLAEEISGDIITPPYPASYWNLTDNQLTLNDEDWQPMIDVIEGDILTPPYPASFWYVDTDNKLDMAILPRAILGDILEPIYPASLWWYNAEQGCLWMYLQGDPLPLGAFANCHRLEYMKIPENVKSLGEETFKNTNLIEVTIADDCTYSSETFPPGCQVKYYSD